MGKSLISKLVSEKHKVFVLDKEKNFERVKSFKIYKAKFIYGNFENKNLVKNIIKNNKIEAIFHLGAITQVLYALQNPYLTYQTNIIGTLNIIDSIRELRRNILFIYSSSDKAYGEIKKRDYTEKDNLNPIFPYDLSKSSSDLICQSYSKNFGLRVGIVRCGNLYGPGDFNIKRIIPDTIISALKERRLIIRSNGKLRRDYVFIDDASNAYYLIFKKLIYSKKKLLIYNVGSSDNLSVIEIVNLILKRMRKQYLKPIIKNISNKEIINQSLNYRKIRREISWKPRVKLIKGIDLTIKWYKENIKKTIW